MENEGERLGMREGGGRERDTKYDTTATIAATFYCLCCCCYYYSITTTTTIHNNNSNDNSNTCLSRALGTNNHRLVSLVVNASARQRKIHGSNPACDGIFPGRVIPVTSKLALQWLPFQEPAVIETGRPGVSIL